MKLVVYLWAFALPGTPLLDCGQQRCLLGTYDSYVVCDHMLTHDKRFDDMNVILRCTRRKL